MACIMVPSSVLTILQTVKERDQIWQSCHSPVCKIHVFSSAYSHASFKVSASASASGAAGRAESPTQHMSVVPEQADELARQLCRSKLLPDILRRDPHNTAPGHVYALQGHTIRKCRTMPR